MIEAAIAQFDIKCESILAPPLVFDLPTVQQWASNALVAFGPLGVLSSQISLRRGDEVFDYELQTLLYNGLGKWTGTSQSVAMEFHQGRSSDDLKVVIDALSRSRNIVSETSGIRSSLVLFLHVLCENEQTRDAYLKKFAEVAIGATRGGLVIYGRYAPWNEDLRFQVDISLAFSQGLFLSVTTFYDAPFTAEIGLNILSAAQSAAKSLGLTIKGVL